MKKTTSWKFTDELFVTFQFSVSGAGEFGLNIGMYMLSELNENSVTGVFYEKNSFL